MPRCGRPASRAVSRPACAEGKNPALSANRKLFGHSTIASHPARSAPAVAPHDPPGSADACRSAISRPILFRRGLPQGRSLSAAKDREQRIAAVHEAYRQSASALTQTAVVCGLGILVFAASSFAPSRRFAGMLSLLVGAALVGDLVLLPALLAGPLGRSFRSSARGEAVTSGVQKRCDI